MDLFIIRACTAGIPLTLILVGVAVVDGDPVIGGAGVGGVAGCAYGIWSGRRGRGRQAGWLLLFALSFASAATTLFKPADPLALSATSHAVIYPVLAALALGWRAGAVIAGWNLALYAFAFPWVAAHTGAAAGPLAYEFTMLFFGVTIPTFGAALFTERGKRLRTKLDERLGQIERAAGHARRVAAGDLRAELDGEGDVEEVLREMLGGLRAMVQRIQAAAAALEPLSEQLAALAGRQGELAARHLEAVASIRGAADEAATSGQAIMGAADHVATLAGESLTSSEATAERSERLLVDTTRVSTLLGAISDVAQQTEILALNAELEGIRAGLSGGGFTVVAGRMRELSDRVAELADQLAERNRQLQASGQQTRAATSTSKQGARDTREAADRIRGLVQAQTVDSDRVVTEVEVLGRGTGELESAARQLEAATGELDGLLATLREALRGFSV